MFVPANEGHFWKISFNAGVNMDEKMLEENFCQKTPEEDMDYVERYDLLYLTPCSNEIRVKVSISLREDVSSSSLTFNCINCLW